LANWRREELHQPDRSRPEKVCHSYVRYVVPLGLLAPKLMEAICAGQQSVTISAERLKDHARFPIEWNTQQRLLWD
jgi:hypothetical protein